MAQAVVAKIHTESFGTYGYVRVAAELRLGHGVIVNHKLVYSIMREQGLKGLPKQPPGRRGPVGAFVAADLVRRDFSGDGPNKLWVTDITEHPTREGKVFCCAVLDAFSRKVVGWSIDSTQTAALVTSALGMAIKGRDPDPRTVIHSDRGTQGGFKWSSQHPSTEVCDGQASWVDDRVDGQGTDEIAGQAVVAARCRAAVLA
jgi:putative transposase